MTSVIEINSGSCGISVSKGFLVISIKDGDEKIALDEIEALILNSRGARISNRALARLAGEGIPIIHSGANSLPCALTLPYGANTYRKERIERQVNCSLPLKKNLWRQVVRAKIRNQAVVLKLNGRKSKDLELLADKVQSGDKGNAEAVAARFYWERMFHKGFKRDPDLTGINSFLNYGYSILRAAMGRRIVATGLLPELGIHHRNMLDAYCLADDLMEPYRPFVDARVSCLGLEPESPLTPAFKKALICLLDLRLEHSGESTHLRHCLQKTVEQYVGSVASKMAGLEFPGLTSDTMGAIKENQT